MQREARWLDMRCNDGNNVSGSWHTNSTQAEENLVVTDDLDTVLNQFWTANQRREWTKDGAVVPVRCGLRTRSENECLVWRDTTEARTGTRGTSRRSVRV
jgi:hypothetical protein